MTSKCEMNHINIEFTSKKECFLFRPHHDNSFGTTVWESLLYSMVLTSLLYYAEQRQYK